MGLPARWLSGILFVLFGCRPVTEPSRQAAAPPPSARGSVAATSAGLRELRVGVSGEYAPFSLQRADGSLHGFDAELARAMAGELGMKPRWVTFRWPELAQNVRDGDFDVAMSGVTWQPARAVSGYMTRSVARGGPCLLGDVESQRVAVNRGGALEAWARASLPGRELVVVDDNQSLPTLLSEQRVGAIVTDSFERRAFARPGWTAKCEPALSQKVYWVAPRRAAELGPRIDEWLRVNAPRIRELQQRWFGEHQRLDPAAHLVDLLARRFAFMPLVAAIKAERHLPIEDVPRERELLAATAQSAQRAGLAGESVLALFRTLIELSKDVQRRKSEPSQLDLREQIRPALNELGQRILAALSEARAQDALQSLSFSELDALSPWLNDAERGQVLAALRSIELAPRELSRAK